MCERHWESRVMGYDPCPICEGQREMEERIQSALAKAAQEATANNHALSPRFRTKTFENYRLSPDILTASKQKAALKSCREFVDSYPKRTGLVLLGSNGTGKNHLACAIVNALQKLRGKSCTALVTTAYGLIVDLKATWDRQGDKERITHDRLLDQLRRYDIVVIDEIGAQFGSVTDKLLLTHVVNLRYEWQRPTVFVGNVAAGELREHLGTRIIDRLYEDDPGPGDSPAFVVSCVWPSYRRRPAGVTA